MLHCIKVGNWANGHEMSHQIKTSFVIKRWAPFMLKWYLHIYFFIEYLKCVWKSNCIWIIRNDSKKKKFEDRVPGSGFGLRVGSSTAARAYTFLVVSKPRFIRFYKMNF